MYNYDKNIPLAKGSFIAFIRYAKKDKSLIIVLSSSGKQYRYKSVPVSLFHNICDSSNKGSFIASNVINSRKYEAELLPTPVPMAVLEQVTMPARTKHWLAR